MEEIKVRSTIQNDSNTCKCCSKMFVVQNQGIWFCCYCSSKNPMWHCPKCFDSKPKHELKDIVKSMISITISTPKKVEIKEKKAPVPINWIKIDKLTCLYCKQKQDDCEFSDTYCYDCSLKSQ